MPSRPAAPLALSVLLGLGMAACGGAASTSVVTSPTAAATPSPGVTPSPSPDVERVEAVETGLGAYLLTVVPVAVVRNLAGGHTARGVAVHLSVQVQGAEVGASDVTLGSLAAGASAAVAGRVESAARPGASVTATVRVDSWTQQAATTIPEATAVSFTCPRCTDRGGSGDAVGTLALVTVPGPVLQLTAVCRDQAGGIVGGGSQVISAPAAPGPTAVSVPAVVSRRPATCSIDAAVGGF